jgi:hypothetical protein
MDNLSDKQKTLDVLSLPLTAVDSYLGFVYPFVPADSLSPLQIEVYKSQFK